MLIALQSYGFFAFCAVVSFIGLVWVWFFVPELAGRSLESTDTLFALPWYQVGRFGNKLAPDTRAMVVDVDEKAAVATNAQHVEYGRGNVEK
jgi:hypothetical protein